MSFPNNVFLHTASGIAPVVSRNYAGGLDQQDGHQEPLDPDQATLVPAEDGLCQDQKQEVPE